MTAWTLACHQFTPDLMISAIIDEHRQYMADDVRMSAFRRAIAETVRQGDVVLDLGCGTGVLGLLACRAGASRVYAVDRGPVIELARQIALANGLQDRICHIKGDSQQVELPEPVDVIVADQIGRFGFDTGIRTDYADAAARWLKPGGRVIPQQVRLFLAPIEAPDAWKAVDFWQDTKAGIHLSAADVVAKNVAYPVKLTRQHLLADPLPFAAFEPGRTDSPILKFDSAFVATRAGVLHGVGGWFEAQLSPSVAMTNSPVADERIDRMNLYFPVVDPRSVAAGDSINVHMLADTARLVVSWNASVLAAGGALTQPGGFRHSTLKAALISADDLQKRKMDFAPSLSFMGVAERAVLDMCDGGRSLADIEAELTHRFPQLFASRRKASSFVAEIIDRCCK